MRIPLNLESDPDGKGPHEQGAKLDNGKCMAGLLLDFGRALERVADVGTYGAHKYARGSWLHVRDAEQRYTDAMLRHTLKVGRQELDPDTGIEELAHVAWNALAVLELKLR